MAETYPGIAKVYTGWAGVIALESAVSGGATTAISARAFRWESAPSLWMRAARSASQKLAGTWVADIDPTTGKLSMLVSGYTGAWTITTTSSSSTETRTGITSAMNGTAGGAAVLAAVAHPDAYYPSRAFYHQILDLAHGAGECMGASNYASGPISQPTSVSLVAYDTTANLWAMESALVSGHRWDVWDNRRIAARVVLETVKRSPLGRTKITTGEHRLDIRGKATHRDTLEDTG